MESRTDSRLPRGVLAVVAVGLIGCAAAPLLSTDAPTAAAELQWERTTGLAASRPAPIPGGGEMRIAAAELRATEPNDSGYRLFRASGVLRIDRGAAVGRGRATCTMRVQRRTIVAHTAAHVAAFPSPSEDLRDQPVPESVVVEFNSHSTEFARLGLADAFDRFATVGGVTLEWAPYRIGRMRWRWGLPPGRPRTPLKLGFAAFWRTTATPFAHVACTIANSAGAATARAEGSLGGGAPAPSG